MQPKILLLPLIFLLALATQGCATLEAPADAARPAAPAPNPSSQEEGEEPEVAAAPPSGGTVKARVVGNSQVLVGTDCDTKRKVVEVSTTGRDASERSEASYNVKSGDIVARGDSVIRIQESNTKADTCHLVEGGTQSPTNANWMERLGGFLLGLFASGAM